MENEYIYIEDMLKAMGVDDIINIEGLINAYGNCRWSKDGGIEVEVVLHDEDLKKSTTSWTKA